MKKTYLLTTAIICTMQAFGETPQQQVAPQPATASQPSTAVIQSTLPVQNQIVAPPADTPMVLPQSLSKKMPTPLPGALPPRKSGSTSNGSKVPLPIPNIPGIIAYVDLKTGQQALDDATAFVVSDTGGRIACFADNNGVMQTGIVIGAQTNQPTQCYLLDTETGSGKMFSTFKIPISNAPIHWVSGPSSNPDGWITSEKDKIPTDDALKPLTGICAQNDGNGKPLLLGSAVRRRGEPHECVLPNGRYLINRPEILVLAK